MFQDIRTILFTSNLSATSRFTFNQAAMIASRFDAKIILLHVIEKMPENYESRMAGLFGSYAKWQNLLQ